MYPFRDPEWQLHIPQKEHITIVLTHLYCISTRGPVRGVASPALTAGPSLSAPDVRNGAVGVAAEQASALQEVCCHRK